MHTSAANCTGCHTQLDRAIRPVRLLDLVFHGACVPKCRACGLRLGTADESRWRYTVRPLDRPSRNRVEPAAFWCPGCWTIR